MAEEIIDLRGHLIDPLILPKVLDLIMARQGPAVNPAAGPARAVRAGGARARGRRTRARRRR